MACAEKRIGSFQLKDPVSWVVPHWQHPLTSATQLPNVPTHTNKCHYHNPVIHSSLLRPIMPGQLWFLQQRWLKHKTNQPVELWQQCVGLFKMFCWFLVKEKKNTSQSSKLLHRLSAIRTCLHLIMQVCFKTYVSTSFSSLVCGLLVRPKHLFWK